MEEKEIIKELDKSTTLIQGNKEIELLNKSGVVGGNFKNSRARKKHIIDLSLMGLSTKSIQEQINKLAPVKGWKPIEDESKIKYMLSQHFKQVSTPNGIDYDEHIQGLKELEFEKQEKLLEKATLELNNNKKDWKPFEKINAIKETFLMRSKLMEARNYDASKYNPNADIHNTSNQINIFIDNSRKIQFGNSEIPELADFKKLLTEKLNNG